MIFWLHKTWIMLQKLLVNQPVLLFSSTELTVHWTNLNGFSTDMRLGWISSAFGELILQVSLGTVNITMTHILCPFYPTLSGTRHNATHSTTQKNKINLKHARTRTPTLILKTLRSFLQPFLPAGVSLPEAPPKLTLLSWDNDCIARINPGSPSKAEEQANIQSE